MPNSSHYLATLLLVPGFLATSGPAHAQQDETPPTFHGDALPVFRDHCASCHRPEAPSVGGITAPMSLLDYDAARQWAPLVKRAVQSGYMPPWGAHVRHKGEFKGERYLEEAEKALLVAWVDGGALEGDPPARSAAEAEKALSTTQHASGSPASEWVIGEPDLIAGFEKPVYLPDDLVDWQPTIPMKVLGGEHTEPKWISRTELNFGGPWVHHIVSSHMGVGVPGRGPFSYPEGWGVLLPENPYISVNMHYNKRPGPDTARYDNTRGGFEFYEDGEVIDYVVQTNLLPHTDWSIPPGHPDYEVNNTHDIEQDIYLLSMGPHMHYRGKAMRYELEYPDGEMETLLWVPDYDFNWQFLYEYQEPKFIPAGSTLHMSWWFDNSENNPANPDSTAEVEYGPATTDEMANARIYYAPTSKRGIVVGEEIPDDVLKAARDAEQARRERIENELAEGSDDFSWLNEDSD